MILRTLTHFLKRKCHTKIILHCKTLTSSAKPPWRIMFFGTDDFSVTSLKCLNDEFKTGKLINNLEVVTSLKSNLNPVKKYATHEKLITHGWPVTIPDNNFDVGIVVSFGHLIPDEIINKFHFGIINVHASLLPRWRGAAPIIHTILNRDSETGVTIMRVRPKKFDIGEIIKQVKIKVDECVLMPDLYKELSELGANTLVSCLKNLPNCVQDAKRQPEDGITNAPKVTSAMAQINWNEMSAQYVYALARALHDLYPLTTSWNNIPVKLFGVVPTNFIINSCELSPGSIQYNKQLNRLLIKCCDGEWITCTRLGLPAKKPMSPNDFNNGYLKKTNVENRIFK